MKALMLVLVLCSVARAGAVWNPPDDVAERLHAAAEKAEPAAALESVMRAAKADPEAIAFAKRFPDEAGYLWKATRRGAVQIGTISFPLRASNLSEPCAIDATGKLVRPAGPEGAEVDELRKNKRFRKLARRENLEAYPPEDEPRVVAGAGGALELIYAHPLRTCARCPSRGVARVSHRFDGAGKYLGHRVLDVR